MLKIFAEANIQRHENLESTRTSLFEIFGETDEFSHFEELLQKCLRADSNLRPRTAIELRNERVLVDFLNRIENGARPCDLVRPPFEDEKDTKIRELKEEITIKDRKIADLKNRLNSDQNARQQIRQKDEIIETLNQVFSNEKILFTQIKEILKLKTENKNWKNEITKMRQTNSKLESDLRENQKIIEQLVNVNLMFFYL